MQKFITAVCIIFFCFTTIALAQETTPLKEQKDKLSYSVGVTIGKSMKRDSIDVNPELLVQGIKDGIAGGKFLLTDEEMVETFKTLQQDMAAKQAEARKALAEKNLKEGEQFLAENAKKEGVVTRPSGLQYKIITQGSGKQAKSTDTVTVHYRGTLTDGTEFDSSYKRNEPASFPLNEVMAGWTEGVSLMKVGSKWQLFIPSKLGYGENGAGDVIGPNATLIFEVELLDTKDAAVAKKPSKTKTTPAKKTTSKPAEKAAGTSATK